MQILNFPCQKNDTSHTILVQPLLAPFWRIMFKSEPAALAKPTRVIEEKHSPHPSTQTKKRIHNLMESRKSDGEKRDQREREKEKTRREKEREGERNKDKYRE